MNKVRKFNLLRKLNIFVLALTISILLICGTFHALGMIPQDEWNIIFWIALSIMILAIIVHFILFYYFVFVHPDIPIY